MTVRPPPGRAGRAWLAARVATAERAADLLEHKQQLLRREQRRLAVLVEHTADEWRQVALDAERWNARALVAGGRDELHRAAPRVASADAELVWTTQAGVTYPATVSTRLPERPNVNGAVALGQAAEACRAALAAGVRHAAASGALERVTREALATTRRMRAVRDRWLPELRQELDALDLRLDETEREEVTQLRWAQKRPASGEGMA